MPYTIRTTPTHRRQNPFRLVGAPVSMRTHTVGGVSTHAYARVLSANALAVRALQWYNHSMVRPQQSSPGSDTTVFRIVGSILPRTGSDALAVQCIAPLASKFCGGLAPPSKIVWGQMLPLPPRFLRLCYMQPTCGSTRPWLPQSL